jgi:glycosyltransferase involved in cell wall biosynthesis
VLLVGGGPQDANLKAQAQRLGVADKVIFTGRVPHASVSRYYDLIDLLIYPRHSMRLTELVTPAPRGDGPGPSLRGLGCRWPPGADPRRRDGPALRRRQSGRPGGGGNDMLDHREKWPAMRAAGRRFVEDVRNWKNSVANYRKVYDQLLGSRPA